MSGQVVMSPCEEWPRLKDRDGYARFGRWLVARERWIAERGPIPPKLQIDHLCRNRGCIRLDHLEVVTAKENNRRSNNFAGVNSRKTHCAHGHLLTPENLYKDSGHGRKCIACNKARCRKFYLKNRSAK